MVGGVGGFSVLLARVWFEIVKSGMDLGGLVWRYLLDARAIVEGFTVLDDMFWSLGRL